MPSGRTHDAITFLLAAPSAATAYLITGGLTSAAVVAAAFVFGGLMFGPDLDTVSRQYSRWSIFRFLWIPYRRFFSHRSRFTHGLIFGALIRVVYFLGALSIFALIVAGTDAVFADGEIPGFNDLTRVWRVVGIFVRRNFGEYFFLFVFLGLWLGAASHTFTDMAGSYIKTGRVAKFL
ncbi:MAG: metal-binding protein [Pyrinomonadaceae bacterium]